MHGQIRPMTASVERLDYPDSEPTPSPPKPATIQEK